MKKIKWLLPAIVVFAACSKKDSGPSQPTVTPAKGVYVLSEGNFGNNNTDLAYYDFASKTSTGNFYKTANGGTGLGDTGNDIIIYGAKMYIVMHGSNNVTVVEKGTAKLVKKIDFTGKQPRYAASNNGKVYVTSYDGTVAVIDTASLTITKNIIVGSNPEGLAIVGNYLYVANSGGLNFPNVDSTVSVVDLTTQAEIKKIKVGLSPNKIEVNSLGDVYVSLYGVFPTIANLAVIDSKTNTLKKIYGDAFKYTHIRIYNDIAYLYSTYSSTPNDFKVLDTKTGTVIRNAFITDGTSITNAYGINIDESNGDVYIADSKDFVSSGSVVCFGQDGRKKFDFSIAPGVSPNKIVFIR